MDIVLRHLDRLFNRLYSSKYNPIYRSGSIALGLFLIALVTGLYLIFFYRLGEPYESVKAVSQNVWFGSWVRSVHRYASDLMVISVVFHIMRMIAQRKAWGPRMLAWITGVGLVALMLISGWTGFVMVWDAQAQELAKAGARIFDSLGLFSDPISRSFSGVEEAPASFFFLNLFLHVAIPLGMVFGIWAHTSRLARADWFPNRRTLYGMTGVLILASIIAPAPLGPKADLLQRPGSYPVDWIFNFWMGWVESSPLLTFFFFLFGGLILAAAPWYLKPKGDTSPAFNDPNICKGCTQCVQDCPYEAIRMVSKDVQSKMKTVAEVNPDLCVSCGICSASCEPMTIGPEGRKAGEQLKEARSFLASQTEEAQNQTLIIGCRNQADVLAKLNRHSQSHTRYQCYSVDCAGTIHSVVYNILAAQFGRVVIAACPERNCKNKDGYMLLTERISGKREPTLLKTSLRDRIEIHEVGDGEESGFLKEIQNVPHSADAQAKKFSRKKLSAVVASVALALVVAGLVRIPAATSPDSGLLRLSIRLVGQSEKTCHTPTAEELAKIPRHMRAAEVCTYRALTYQLKLNIDGHEYLNEQVHPGGFKRDRPIYVSREIEMEAGEHEVEFSLEPLESNDPSVVSLSLQKRIEFKPGHVALIYYSPNEKGAVVKEARHE